MWEEEKIEETLGDDLEQIRIVGDTPTYIGNLVNDYPDS